MKHFGYIENKNEFFYKQPIEINKNGDKMEVASALGALLYMPATKKSWEQDLINKKHEGLTSMVLDLEDALKESDFSNGIDNIQKGFKVLEESELSLPLIFIRVKHHNDMYKIVSGLGEDVNKLTGLILPKFDSMNSKQYVEKIININSRLNNKLYVMPIIESRRVMDKETRYEELRIIKEDLRLIKEFVLNIRVGATDFTSNYGIRRTPHNTVYDMRVISECLSDIVNYFGNEIEGNILSGPVWEFFDGSDRILKSQLRETIFEDYGKLGKRKRKELLGEYNDGLIKEVLLDKINGFTGKTIIHPSHIKIVNSLYAVSYEEYQDALEILEYDRYEGGVLKSNSGNKMNEIKPHYYWAEKIFLRSKVFGVLKEDKNFIDLLIN